MCTRYLSYILPLDIDCGNGNSTGELGGMGIMCKIQNGGMGTGMSLWKWEGMRIPKVIPAHLYSKQLTLT